MMMMIIMIVVGIIVTTDVVDNDFVHSIGIVNAIVEENIWHG
jgi:hypothetical protein